MQIFTGKKLAWVRVGRVNPSSSKGKREVMQWKVKVSSWWYSNALLRLGNNFWCNMESKIFYVGHWLWLSWESGCFPLQTSTFESGSNPVIGIIYIEYSLWTVLKRRNLGFCFFLKNVHYPIFFFTLPFVLSLLSKLLIYKSWKISGFKPGPSGVGRNL